ncbi:polymorphic toxin-type HINT domain-containing protein, partial [Coleofasciculus sp.]|uniref:polymorphic toxin-type HINT domain-containing protein n=1 Tax=Coleofasciculus sp. TaxID=3100458 RepID=UPI003A212200
VNKGLKYVDDIIGLVGKYGDEVLPLVKNSPEILEIILKNPEVAELFIKNADDVIAKYGDDGIEMLLQGVMAKRVTPDGHTLKVLASGQIVRCSTCGKLAQEFAEELADPRNRHLLDKLNDLEKRAKVDPEGVADEIQKLERQLQDVRKTKPSVQPDANFIPEGGIPIEERLAQGGNPPPHVRENPEKYYYDPASGKYPRRPEPAPDFSGGRGERAIPCFPRGTLVVTTDGVVPIEQLVLGTTVRAFDEVTKATLDKPITAILGNKTVRLVDVTTDSETISATTRHRFWVEDKNQWIAAKYLETGMLLRTVAGAVSEVKSIGIRQVVEQDTYNLTVSDCHTYFVGSEGLLVHNADEVPKGKIYIGRDPQGNIIYVGQTKQTLWEREFQHHSDAVKQPEKYGFKKDMKLELVPAMDGLSDDEMFYHERRIYDKLGGKDKLKNIIEPMGDQKINALIKQYCS